MAAWYIYLSPDVAVANLVRWRSSWRLLRASKAASHGLKSMTPPNVTPQYRPEWGSLGIRAGSLELIQAVVATTLILAANVLVHVFMRTQKVISVLPAC